MKQSDAMRALGWRWPLWAIVLVCCALPLGWIVWQVVAHPSALIEFRLDAFRARLLGRTILYNGLAGILATGISIPCALLLGRGRGWIARGVWFVLPIALLLPSITYAYGWSQFIRITRSYWIDAFGWSFIPGSVEDIARCIWSLATWLWPIPAAIVGIALRRMDTQVQQQAMLDGGYFRVVARQLAGPVVASFAIVTILAMQEFSVYEPTGISVIATEIRMVYDTGAFSSPDNLITQPILEGENDSHTTQAERAAASVAAGAPMLAIVALLSGVALIGAGRLASSESSVEIGPWPRVLDAPAWTTFAAICTLIVTLVVPLVAMGISLRRPWIWRDVWITFWPQISGSLLIGSIGGAVAISMAMLAATARSRLVGILSIAAFLAGGQLLAIAMIRLYNRPWLEQWIYNAVPIMVMAYIGRFGWLALAAGGSSWSGSAWRELREMAMIDGASPGQCAWRVIVPLIWPLLAAAGVLVTILSLTEVPATVLLNPARVPMLTPLLMQWVHMVRYDDMIQGSLLMAGIVVALAIVMAILIAVGMRRAKSPSRLIRSVLSFCILHSALCILPGCSRSSEPDAVWCEPGMGIGQLVYPRGVAYSKSDDTFFVVDRSARIQHLSNTGEFLGGWRMPEWSAGKPVGVTVGPDGNIYIADTHYSRVMVYSPKGQLLRKWGTHGTGPGEFIYPTDVAFDPKSGRIFVAEYGDHDRVQIFDSNGNYLSEFGSFGVEDGQFVRPQAIAIADDLLYVADSCNHRIAVFDLDGKFVRNMGKVGAGLGEFRFPYGLDLDADGNLIVCEYGNNRIQKIDRRSGQGLATWGSAGHLRGQLSFPWAVAVDKDNRIATVDAGNDRVQVFQF